MSALAQEDREFIDRLRAELAQPAVLPLSTYERLLDEQRAARIDEAEAAARQSWYDPVREVWSIEVRKHGGELEMELEHRRIAREVARDRAMARKARREE